MLRRFGHGLTLSRREALSASLSLTGGALLPAAARAQPATPVAEIADAILAIGARLQTELALRALLLHVEIDGETIAHDAFGESLTGQPATPEMHVRNGAVAITYMAVLLLRLVDEGRLALDDPIDRWLPELPEADAATLRMLANMTAGYPDYVQNPDFVERFYDDPFRAWSGDELIELGLAQPRRFAPGENWDYSHTNYVLLGRALEAVTGEPLDQLLLSYVLEPLGLTGTAGEQSAWLPEPALHAFSSERREHLGIPAGRRFYEESTYWNPSWTVAPGAVQYSTVADMAGSFAAIGRGELLSAESYQALTSDALLGFGALLDGCPSCHTLDAAYNYGLGIVRSGEWLLQNPLFGGYGGVAAYHPGERIAIAAVTTFAEQSFDEAGNALSGRASTVVFREIGELLAPESPPLLRR